MSIRMFNKWQTARAPTTAGDTLLTDYDQADLTAAVRAKMFSVSPAAAVALRCLGKDTDLDTISGVVISGWMKPTGTDADAGFGFRLWTGNLILGAQSRATSVPLNDGRWGDPATWLEVDTWTDVTDVVGTKVLTAADQESLMIVPTLGFTDMLIEIPAASLGGAGEADEVGFLWRPVAFDNAVVPTLAL